MSLRLPPPRGAAAFFIWPHRSAGLRSWCSAHVVPKVLGAADLVATLKGDGPFTVFAPTDEAFAKLPAGTVETLLKPENKEKLKEILLLHVVPGKVTAADVVKLKEAKTAGGKTLTISTAGGVKVGTATGLSNVVKTDVQAKNGVIHVIDAVILP
ncbi:MAG: fasciclin domain-containing protein [Planctomycetia bacterium]